MTCLHPRIKTKICPKCGQKFHTLIKDVENCPECERLQGFPDNWTDGVSDTQRYKQMGNAVTVNVIQAIAERWTANTYKVNRLGGEKC